MERRGIENNIFYGSALLHHVLPVNALFIVSKNQTMPFSKRFSKAFFNSSNTSAITGRNTFFYSQPAYPFQVNLLPKQHLISAFNLQ